MTKDYFTTQTLVPGVEIENIHALKTWAERIRIHIGKPVHFHCVEVPSGNYTQLKFIGGVCAEAFPNRPNSGVGDTVRLGVVEGFTSDEGEFVACRILDETGVPAVGPAAMEGLLKQCNFSNVAKWHTPPLPGFHEITNIALQEKLLTSQSSSCVGLVCAVTHNDYYVSVLHDTDMSPSVFLRFTIQKPEVEAKKDNGEAVPKEKEESSPPVKITSTNKPYVRRGAETPQKEDIKKASGDA
jgi:hypothetical protein